MPEITAIFVLLIVGYGLLAYFKPGIALVTVPVVAGTVGYLGVVVGRVEGVLFAGVLLLLTLIIIAASDRDRESQQWARRWASWILTTIAAVLLVLAIFSVLRIVGAGAILPLLFFLGIVAIIAALIGVGINARKTVATEVLTTLGASMRQNLPLPMALDCAAAGRDDASARTFLRIKKWLVQGYSVTEAIRRGYPQCPTRAMAMLTSAEGLGQLPAAFKEVQADLKTRAAERGRLRPVHPAYPFVILIIMFFLVLALMTFVIPTFKTVLEEMMKGATLPWPSRILFGFVAFIVYKTHLWLVLAAMPFVALLLWLRGRWGVRRPVQPYFLSRIGDFLKWHLPVLHWFEMNNSTLQTVELLRLSLKGGCPLDEAIAATLGLDVNLYFRKRLKCWHRSVEAGGNVAQAARRCGLGKALAWAVDTTTGAVETPDVLDMLETFYRSNYSYRVNLARFVLWPCAIILLGATVGFVVIAIFLPSISVIGVMSSYVYP